MLSEFWLQEIAFYSQPLETSEWKYSCIEFRVKTQKQSYVLGNGLELSDGQADEVCLHKKQLWTLD